MAEGGHRKYKAPQHPLLLEKREKFMVPTGAYEQRLMGRFLTHQITHTEDPDIRAAYAAQIVEKTVATRKSNIQKHWVDGFRAWLCGTSVKNSETHFTPWGHKPLFWVPGVTEWLTEELKMHFDFRKKLIELCHDGAFKNIDNAYLYYKYVVCAAEWEKEQRRAGEKGEYPPWYDLDGQIEFLDQYCTSNGDPDTLDHPANEVMPTLPEYGGGRYDTISWDDGPVDHSYGSIGKVFEAMDEEGAGSADSGTDGGKNDGGTSTKKQENEAKKRQATMDFQNKQLQDQLKKRLATEESQKKELQNKLDIQVRQYQADLKRQEANAARDLARLNKELVEAQKRASDLQVTASTIKPVKTTRTKPQLTTVTATPIAIGTFNFDPVAAVAPVAPTVVNVDNPATALALQKALQDVEQKTAAIKDLEATHGLTKTQLAEIQTNYNALVTGSGTTAARLAAALKDLSESEKKHKDVTSALANSAATIEDLKSQMSQQTALLNAKTQQQVTVASQADVALMFKIDGLESQISTLQRQGKGSLPKDVELIQQLQAELSAHKESKAKLEQRIVELRDSNPLRAEVESLKSNKAVTAAELKSVLAKLSIATAATDNQAARIRQLEVAENNATTLIAKLTAEKAALQQQGIANRTLKQKTELGKAKKEIAKIEAQRKEQIAGLEAMIQKVERERNSAAIGVEELRIKIGQQQADAQNAQSQMAEQHKLVVDQLTAEIAKTKEDRDFAIAEANRAAALTTTTTVLVQDDSAVAQIRQQAEVEIARLNGEVEKANQAYGALSQQAQNEQQAKLAFANELSNAQQMIQGLAARNQELENNATLLQQQYQAEADRLLQQQAQAFQQTQQSASDTTQQTNAELEQTQQQLQQTRAQAAAIQSQLEEAKKNEAYLRLLYDSGLTRNQFELRLAIQANDRTAARALFQAAYADAVDWSLNGITDEQWRAQRDFVADGDMNQEIINRANTRFNQLMRSTTEEGDTYRDALGATIAVDRTVPLADLQQLQQQLSTNTAQAQVQVQQAQSYAQDVIEKANAALAEAATKQQQTQLELTKTTQRYERTRLLRAESKRKIKDLERQLGDATDQLDSVRLDNDSLQEIVVDGETKEAELKGQLQDLEAQATTQLGGMQAEASRLRQALADAAASDQDTQAVQAQLQQQIVEMDKHIEMTRMEAGRVIEQKRKEIEFLGKETAALNLELIAEKRKNAALDEKVRALQAQQAQAMQKNDSAVVSQQSALEKYMAASQNVQQLQGDLSRAQEKNKAQKQQIADLLKKQDEYESGLQVDDFEIAALQQQVQQLQEANIALHMTQKRLQQANEVSLAAASAPANTFDDSDIFTNIMSKLEAPTDVSTALTGAPTNPVAHTPENTKPAIRAAALEAIQKLSSVTQDQDDDDDDDEDYNPGEYLYKGRVDPYRLAPEQPESEERTQLYNLLSQQFNRVQAARLTDNILASRARKEVLATYNSASEQIQALSSDTIETAAHKDDIASAAKALGAATLVSNSNSDAPFTPQLATLAFKKPENAVKLFQEAKLWNGFELGEETFAHVGNNGENLDTMFKQMYLNNKKATLTSSQAQFLDLVHQQGQLFAAGGAQAQEARRKAEIAKGSYISALSSLTAYTLHNADGGNSAKAQQLLSEFERAQSGLAVNAPGTMLELVLRGSAIDEPEMRSSAARGNPWPLAAYATERFSGLNVEKKQLTYEEFHRLIHSDGIVTDSTIDTFNRDTQKYAHSAQSFSAAETLPNISAAEAAQQVSADDGGGGEINDITQRGAFAGANAQITNPYNTGLMRGSLEAALKRSGAAIGSEQAFSTILLYQNLMGIGREASGTNASGWEAIGAAVHSKRVSVSQAQRVLGNMYQLVNASRSSGDALTIEQIMGPQFLQELSRPAQTPTIANYNHLINNVIFGKQLAATTRLNRAFSAPTGFVSRIPNSQRTAISIKQ